MLVPGELTFGRLIVKLQRLHGKIPGLFPGMEDNERVADLQEAVQNTIYIARAARCSLQGFAEDTPLGLKRALEVAIQEIHSDHTLRQKSTLAAPKATAQNAAVTTSTSPTPNQPSTAPTIATKKAPESKENDTCTHPTAVDTQESASRASNEKPSVQLTTRSSFTPENITDADHEAAATLISLSESDHNPNSSFNSSRSSSFAVPTPAQSHSATMPGASFPSTIRDASFSSLLYSSHNSSTRSHDFFAKMFSRNIAAFATSRNVTSSSPSHSIPVYTTNTNSTPRKRSRDINIDTDAGISYVDTHSSSPPAPKRRSVSPIITSATQAAPVSPLLDDQMSVHQAFAMGLEYALLHLGGRLDPTAVEELWFRAAVKLRGATAGLNDNILAEHGTNGVADGCKKPSSNARGFWDVI